MKIKIGREYEIQGRFAKVESIEGDTIVCRDRWGHRFECDKGEAKEKRKIKKLP